MQYDKEATKINLMIAPLAISSSLKANLPYFILQMRSKCVRFATYLYVYIFDRNFKFQELGTP